MKWEWYHDSQMVHLFLHMLIRANHEPKKWRGTLIQRGQFVSGRKALSVETGISEQSIRTCISKLKSTNELTTKSTNKFTLYTIVNWDTYQINGDGTNQPTNQQPPNNQPTTNQQLTTNKKYKNYKNDKEAAEAAAFLVFGAQPAQLANWIEVHGAYATEQAIWKSQAIRRPNYTNSILQGWAKEGYPERPKSEEEQNSRDAKACMEIDDEFYRSNGDGSCRRGSLDSSAAKARELFEKRSFG